MNCCHLFLFLILNNPSDLKDQLHIFDVYLAINFDQWGNPVKKLRLKDAISQVLCEWNKMLTCKSNRKCPVPDGHFFFGAKSLFVQ